ncbi:MAG: UDP-N-acetyl-D-glucosamine dehydrogenase [Chloroflexi bacterium]|nr:UDP-N-acetyl-D-glucosamine dehydrogenase [Chloroflexota bacterium]|tara:strand:- start:7543 stop:8871 length:1329 start_codon:yes stop_codon:yes gene_type:complete
MHSNLKTKIANKTAQISVVGAGYVGLPLAIAFASTGFNVSVIDNDQTKVKKINARESYINDISSEDIQALSLQKSSKGSLTATTEYSSVKSADCVIICVPTPVSKTKDPDVSFILNAANSIAEYVHEGMLIVLESTTYPGTTEEIIVPILESSPNGNFKIGKNIFVAFSPERIDPNNKVWTVTKTPKVLGGITQECSEIGLSLYQSAIKTIVPVSSTKVAEMVKLLENTYRATNIGLVNEIAIMCDRLDIDVWEVIDAAATKPFGFTPFYPGPGLGGHCIPVDPQFLAWKLKTLNYNARFIQLATEINTGMPDYVVGKVMDILNKQSKSLNGSKVLILGIAYKPNVSDFRESPSLDIIDILRNKGALVSYHDPYIPKLQYEHFDMSSIDINESIMQSFDCVIIATNHDDYDWPWVIQNSHALLDTRNATANTKGSKSHVVKL